MTLSKAVYVNSHITQQHFQLIRCIAQFLCNNSGTCSACVSTFYVSDWIVCRRVHYDYINCVSGC